MYGATTSKTRLADSRKLLEWIYAKIPATKGCMENIAKPASEGGCGAWCCQTQQPQVLYAEFMNTLHHVKTNWSYDKFVGLVELAMRAYLFEEHRKGCIFWDKESLMCSQHNTRPYNCRIYGIVPEEEFTPRYERLKVLYPDTRNQCNLVSTVNGKTVTKTDTDAWWKMMENAEKGLGIKPQDISDNFGGSYRTYYEHLLLETMGEDGMVMLSHMRVHGSNEEKEAIIQQAVAGLRSFVHERTKSEDNNV